MFGRSTVVRYFVVAIVLGAPAATQGRTWIVDQNNGTGTDFTDLPPAIKAAASADTLIIRTGVYRGFRTGKALTLLGEPPVTVVAANDNLSGTVIEVSGLSAGLPFVAKHLTVSFSKHWTAIGFTNSPDGRFHLEDVDTQPFLTRHSEGTSTHGGVGVAVSTCKWVSIRGGVLRGRTALSTDSSTVTLTAVTIFGGSAFKTSFSSMAAGTPGIRTAGSNVYLSATRVYGGNGGVLFSGYPFPALPAPAIVLATGRIEVTGDATTALIVAGYHPDPPTAQPIPAVDTTSGELVLDPNARLSPSHGGAPIRGPATVTVRRIASLRATGAPPGGVVIGDIVSPAGDASVLLAGRPVGPVRTQFANLYLDASEHFVIGLAIQGPGEHSPFAVPIPPLAVLDGFALAFQLVHVYRGTSIVELSIPAVVVLQ